MTDFDDQECAPATIVEPAGSGDALLSAFSTPALFAWVGDRGALRTLEFLTASIRNVHTRRAYHRAAGRFAAWCARRGLALAAIRGPHVAAYIDQLALGEVLGPRAAAKPLAPLSVKQHLAALKHWFDHLVTGRVLEVNPAHAVRGPRYSQTTGKTPVLEREDARKLLESIDGSTVTGARDQALIAVMLFSFARIGAVLAMRVRDYHGAWTSAATLTFHEKGGKFHRVPAHHMAAEYLDAYIALAGLVETPDPPLWQSSPGRKEKLSGVALGQRGALDIMKRRCRAAGLPEDICNHSLRATGITLHQDAGGDLEAARQIAGHANIKTTQLYNRSGDRKRRNEVERVQL